MFQSTSETVNILYKQIQLYKHKYIYIVIYRFYNVKEPTTSPPSQNRV